MADPQMAGDPTQDPTAGAATEAEPPEGQSSDYVIELKISGQSIKVGVESADDEAQEEQGGGEGGSDDENYQEVGSIGEACRLIRQIFASQGQTGPTDSEGAEQMAAGYK